MCVGVYEQMGKMGKGTSVSRNDRRLDEIMYYVVMRERIKKLTEYALIN